MIALLFVADRGIFACKGRVKNIESKRLFHPVRLPSNTESVLCIMRMLEDNADGRHSREEHAAGTIGSVQVNVCRSVEMNPG